MSDEITYPSWWSSPGGAVVQCRNALEVQEGWVQRFGHYDTQIGQFVPDSVLDHDHDGKPGGSTKQGGGAIKDLRAAYKEAFGKKPFGGWDEATLIDKLKAA